MSPASNTPSVPFYTDGAVTIYHADCLDVLGELPVADLAFADPPYNSGLSYGPDTDDSREDYWDWLGVRLALLDEVGEVVLVKHSALKLGAFMERWPGRVLVWTKSVTAGYPIKGISMHWEPVHWLKGSACQHSKDIFDCPAIINTRDRSTGHRAQFPEAVAGWLIQTFTNPGGLVIDAFAGSGTMLRAAKDLGRYAIGIEIEEHWCQVAADRCAQDVLEFAS